MSHSSSDHHDRHLGASGDTPVPPDETRVISVLKEYMQQLEAGKVPDRQALLQQHPDIADRLAEYLDGLEFVHGAARPVIDDAQAEGPPASADQRTDAPRTLGDFTILREIGRGGMGTVYEAKQVSLGRRVAIKILPFAAVLDTKYLERFKNEASAAASLDHPGIVAVYAVGCERGIHFYAMQLIDGYSLTEVITELRRTRDGRPERPVAGHQPPDGVPPDSVPRDNVPDSADEIPLPGDNETIRDSATLAGITTEASTRTAEFFRSVAQLGVQAAEALDFAHERGIVHRDIKPSNLLVDRNARIWIADFGLAMTKTTADLTMTGDLVGTLRYMSPEQAAGDRRRLDHRTDVYSLGATLYELVTLRPLFTATDQQRLLHDISERDPPRPRKQGLCCRVLAGRQDVCFGRP